MSALTLGSAPTSNVFLQHAITASKPLLTTWYNTTAGLWDTTGWWTAANTITTLGDLAFLHPPLQPQIETIFTTTFRHAQSTYPGYINDFYDDEAWWALAWINAYDLTNNTGYLSQSAQIFEDLTKGWTTPCGGIWWNKEKTSVNAIANALFLSVAAHLSRRIPSNSTYYLQWANRELDWFLNSGMINSDHNINDGLNLSTCKNNNGTIWSYNQGVILGALTELDQISHNSTYIPLAKSIAKAAITKLSTTHGANGVLRDLCDPTCDVTGTQFKGVFMRNLQRLQLHAPEAEFERFIMSNANSIWKNSRDATNDTLGESWSGPFGDASATSQSAALDALIAAAAVIPGVANSTQAGGHSSAVQTGTSAKQTSTSTSAGSRSVGKSPIMARSALGASFDKAVMGLLSSLLVFCTWQIP